MTLLGYLGQDDDQEDRQRELEEAQLRPPAAKLGPGASNNAGDAASAKPPDTSATIAKPPTSPTTGGLRGLPPPAAGSSPTTSTTTPPAPPSPLALKTQADQDELTRLERTGSGVSQVAKAHPIAGGILRGLSTAASVAGRMFPALYGPLSVIPGTEEHHRELLHQQKGRLGEDLEEQQSEAVTAKNQADTEEAQARARLANRQADVAGNPKEGLTPEETTIHDLMTGENGQPRVNPDTGKPYTYLEAYTAVQQAKQDTKPEKDPVLGDKVPQLNQMLVSRYQVLNPGAQLPSQYTLPANATQKDYERIDKGLEAEERARGTLEQQKQTNEMRKQTLALAQQRQGEKVGQEATTANATVHAFTRYQKDFSDLAQQLTPDDRKALEVLTSHADVAQGFLGKATSGVLDTLFGEPLTGYSEKAMGGIMTKDQYDKLSPAGKKMLADYFNAIVQNFANMKQMMGSVGRNALQLQAEINTIPLPYLDPQSADAQFADKLEDLNIRNSRIPGYQQAETARPANAAPAAAFQVPADAPPAPKEDGNKLKANGKTIAVSKGGKWVAPQ